MDDLKPCPFCGGNGKIEQDHYAGKTTYLPMCENYNNGCWGMQENWFDTEAEAIAAWNRRAEDD